MRAAEGGVRPDVEPAVTARLLFGLVNSLIGWYQPNRGLRVADRGVLTPRDN